MIILKKKSKRMILNFQKEVNVLMYIIELKKNINLNHFI